jgi:hypothetical protein
MQLEMEAFSAICSLKVFVINGVDADEKDFGDKYDADPDNADGYCCGDMRFFPKPATQDVLDKYSINVIEYNEICEKLDCLSFGSCGWCS